MREKFELLIESMNGVVFEAKPCTPTITFIGENISNILGFEPNECINDENFWLNHSCIDDKEKIVKFFLAPEKYDNILNCKFLSADDKVVHVTTYVTMTYDGDAAQSLFGVIIENTSRSLLEELEHLEKHILELNAAPNSSIESVLNIYINGLENIFRKMKCSILKVSNDKIYNWASPSLQSSYLTAIEGLSIGNNKGSCGTAAYLKERVIVADIEHDIRWAEFKEIALANDLRACWSNPIISSNGKVLATFAMYYNSVKLPNEHELSIIDRASSILTLILENREYLHTIQELHDMAVKGEALANFGTWQWDFNTNTAKWSETMCKIYGVDYTEFIPTYEAYINRIHPEDRERIQNLLINAHNNNSEEIYEERIIRPDGEVRHLKSWFRAISDTDGKTTRIIGASLDITLEKQNYLRMQHIAWQQSHVVRAPLARIMGLVNLINDNTIKDNEEKRKLLGFLKETANELDSVIKEIDYTTRI